MAPKVNTGRLYSDIVTGRGAATQVFSTFELCDLIVQNLSVFDVIRVSGLNLVTKAVVAESTKIQEKLFFRATSDKECKLWGLNRWGDLIAGENITRVLQGKDADNDDPGTMSESTRSQVAHEITYALSAHVVNDLLLFYYPSEGSGWGPGYYGEGIVRRAHNFVHKVGCFESMSVLQALLYGQQSNRRNAPTGVTFGEIVDRLHFELGQVKAATNGYTGANLIFEDGLPVVLPVVKEKVEELGLITSHDRIYIKPYGEPHGDLRI
ncbi:hypothetical protein LTR15_012495 [Elasticomyces elasticus]|nr:hypothetical protein LTR15_012495 [Elasticomyces elasticus]